MPAGSSPTVAMSTGSYRWRRRFRSVWRLLVLVGVLVVLVVVGARLLAGTGTWKHFAADYPAVPHQVGVPAGYPAWLRSLHWFNFLVMTLLVRSGISILADHPRLYWNVHSTPDTEWLRFRGPVPRDQLWTAKDDSVWVSGVIGLPGGRHTVGLARKWHFLDVVLWVGLGTAFVVLLFATSQWRRLVPTSWSIVPAALNCAVTYASLTLPRGAGGATFDALQQLAYFTVIFVAAPLSIMTGLMMSPAIANRFSRAPGGVRNRQLGRSLHFLLACFYIVFIIFHVALVAITNLRPNMSRITLGTAANSWTGVLIGLVIIAVVVAVNVGANKASWHTPLAVLRTYQHVVAPVMGALFDHMVPRSGYRPDQISPFFWPNGKPPTSQTYAELRDNDFRDARLHIHGEVDHEVDLSPTELRALGRSEQITLHDCIQGWSGIAQWAGVPMGAILDLVQPRPGTRYAIFYSYGEGGEGGAYYDAHELVELRRATSILAYEMNFQPLNEVHGAPLRLRNEAQLGFKMVKWVREIEIVTDYRARFAGEGGYAEDHEYFGCKAEI